MALYDIRKNRINRASQDAQEVRDLLHGLRAAAENAQFAREVAEVDEAEAFDHLNEAVGTLQPRRQQQQPSGVTSVTPTVVTPQPASPVSPAPKPAPVRPTPDQVSAVTAALSAGPQESPDPTGLYNALDALGKAGFRLQPHIWDAYNTIARPPQVRTKGSFGRMHTDIDWGEVGKAAILIKEEVKKLEK